MKILLPTYLLIIAEGGLPTSYFIHEWAPRWQPLHVRAACICKPVVVRPLLVTQHVCIPASRQISQPARHFLLPIARPLHVCKMSKFS